LFPEKELSIRATSEERWEFAVASDRLYSSRSDQENRASAIGKSILSSRCRDVRSNDSRTLTLRKRSVEMSVDLRERYCAAES
jgi:hypothetical protein